MEKLVLIHHALFKSLEEQIVCSVCFVGKISNRLKKSWNIFFLFISSSSISFIYERFLLLLNFKSGYLFVATFLLRVVRRLKTYSIFAHRSLSSRISLSLSLLYIFSISLLTVRLLFIPEDKKCHAERIFKRREQRKETMILKRISKKKTLNHHFHLCKYSKTIFSRASEIILRIISLTILILQ